MAAHYDTAVVPTRPHKPKDKAKVEGAVLLVERWILARLRNRQFFSLGEVNAAIRPLLDRLNDKVSRHLGASRRQLFEQLDKPALKPLPVAPYVYAEWKTRSAITCPRTTGSARTGRRNASRCGPPVSGRTSRSSRTS